MWSQESLHHQILFWSPSLSPCWQISHNSNVWKTEMMYYSGLLCIQIISSLVKCFFFHLKLFCSFLNRNVTLQTREVQKNNFQSNRWIGACSHEKSCPGSRRTNGGFIKIVCTVVPSCSLIIITGVVYSNAMIHFYVFGHGVRLEVEN